MTRPLRILVADDHPIVRSGIVALLQSTTDLEVVGEAADGEQAVTLALELKPDLVLMDLRMPRLDGDQATARVVAAAPDIRIIILTTYESDDSILRAIEAGASGYLLKAAPHEEILAGIRSVARGQVALSPAVAALLVRRTAAPPAVAASLSDREAQVLALVAQGQSNRTIAQSLFVSEATVKTHLLHVFGKLGVNDRTRAVTLAMELGLLPRVGS
ncbi:LuxR family two component transcriptional regulator [Glaciihabitans tibetensis]|uniref:LuxR family two component transcriptional regulator n=1 Tax=Glaciihabitans tibetensis TaxID=1266600 RepID=A0A2T0VBL8_9MICO|nr:response regulator transcription factor [Glaciihabitans tibetensis]PRY67477.1 LuxR family two component transcriptional regulator [Glaciihabitans tibetensis]